MHYLDFPDKKENQDDEDDEMQICLLVFLKGVTNILHGHRCRGRPSRSPRQQSRTARAPFPVDVPASLCLLSMIVCPAI